MENKYVVFHIEGGLGKHIVATAVAACIKNNYPDRELIVVCAYPEIYLNLDFVYRVYRHGFTPYFYDNYIKEKDVLIFKHEPYYTTEHITKRLHLIPNWCKLYNLEYRNEQPTVQFNYRQVELGSNLWRRERPILLLQTNGGPLSEQPHPYSWTRDIPYVVGQEIVNRLSSQYHIIQICRNEVNIIPGTEAITRPMTNMELLSLLLFSNKRILIDSCLQHAAAALGLSSTVLWIGTSSNTFGYGIHRNIQAKLPQNFKLPDSYFFDYNFNGMIHECPITDPSTLFNIDEILY